MSFTFISGIKSCDTTKLKGNIYFIGDSKEFKRSLKFHSGY